MRHLAAEFDSAVRSKPVFLVLSLVLIVIALYAPVRQQGFLDWDDDQYVTENPHVQTGFTLSNVVWAVTDNTTFYWHPVTWLSHTLDYKLFGLDAKFHHLENVLLHALNAVILFLLLRRGTGSTWRSMAVSGLFALHPMAVETVAWIAERKSLLSALFSLLTVAAYGWYIEGREPKRYVCMMAVFLLALMSKAMAVTVPVLLLLLDSWPLNPVSNGRKWSEWRPLIIEKVPLLAMSAIVGAFTIYGQDATNAVVRNVPLGMRFEQVIDSYAVYLRKIAWPIDLAAFYPYHVHWYPWIQVLVSGVILTAVTIFAFSRRVPRYVAFGWLFFLTALLPVAGWMPTGKALIADRFVYVPAIGLFIAAIWAVGDLTRNRVPAEFASVVLIGAILAFFAVRTSHELSYWKDSVTLFTRAAAIEKTPDAFLENKLGDALQSAGRLDDALQHYIQSCELDPKVELCHFNIAQISAAKYDAKTALEHYLLASRYTSSPVVARLCLVNSAGMMLYMGDLEGAERLVSQVLAQDPGDQNALRLRQFVQAKKAGYY